MVESCLFVYRITFNRNLAEIPFYLLYGRDAILLQDLMITHKHRINRQKASDDIEIYKPMLLNTLRLAYEKLQEHKRENSLKYKKYYGKSHKPVEYTVGEKVLIHYSIREDEELKYKLGNRWRGPYTIVNKIDAVSYRVKKDIGTSIRIFPVHDFEDCRCYSCREWIWFNLHR